MAEIESFQKLRFNSRMTGEFMDKLDVSAEKEGNENSLDATFDSSVWSTGSLSRMELPSLDENDNDCHFKWYTIILAARHTETENPKQDTLAMHVLQAKALGPILAQRRVKNGATSADGHLVLEPARTSNGERIYSDLPFMLDDFHDSWCQLWLSEKIPSVQLANFAAFIGRLISTGVDNRISICVLVFFRDVLESPETSSPRSSSDMQRIMRAFIVPCRRHLLRLAVQSFNDFPLSLEQSARPGPLARAAGLEQGGFSPARWKFWLKRLESMPEASINTPSAEKDGWTDSILRLLNSLLQDWPKAFGSTAFDDVEEMS
jgi:hypothetical protein